MLLVGTRGNTVASMKSGNYIFSFGCQPSFGVLANSKYMKDFINLVTQNFDESGSVVLPDLFSKVVS